MRKRSKCRERTEFISLRLLRTFICNFTYFFNLTTFSRDFCPFREFENSLKKIDIWIMFFNEIPVHCNGLTCTQITEVYGNLQKMNFTVLHGKPFTRVRAWSSRIFLAVNQFLTYGCYTNKTVKELFVAKMYCHESVYTAWFTKINLRE